MEKTTYIPKRGRRVSTLSPEQQAARLEYMRTRKRDWMRELRSLVPEVREAGIRKDLARYYRKQEKIAGRPRPTHCEVCGQAADFKKRLAFDHCHVHGHFRGWICHRCNVILGMARDDSSVLCALAIYLDRDAARRRARELA